MAAFTHHPALRGQKKARGGEEESEVHYTAEVWKTPPTEPVLFSLYDEEPGGRRPDRLFAVSGPQDRVQRRTVQEIVDIAPLPTLDDPAPQMVEQLPDVLRFFRALIPDPEQVIEVPKIFLGDVPMRTVVLRDTQLAEQLVEVPTIVSYSWLQLGMEQNVNIPVPGRGGRNAGLQGFLPEQSSTPTHSSEDRISERIVEQVVDISVSGGGLQDFRLGQSSSSSSHFQAVVRILPESEGARQCQLIHAGSSAPCSSLGVGHDPH